MVVLVQAAFQSYYMIVSFELEWQVGESRKPAPITIMGPGRAIAIRGETRKCCSNGCLFSDYPDFVTS